VQVNKKLKNRPRVTSSGIVVLCLAVGISIATASAASAKGGGDSVPGPSIQASATISSAGPLTNIFLSDQLNCQVDHVGDSAHEFFGDVPGACATLIATGGTLYGPSVIPAGSSAAPRTTYTTVSQTPVTGTGTDADPFKVVTVVDTSATGLRLTQTDTYVLGTEVYRTDVTVTNLSDVAKTFVLYRAGDCFLQNSDLGLGDLDLASGQVGCRGSDDGVTPNSRIERWVPLTAGSTALEAGFNEVWAAIGTQAPFNNTCLCANYIDNGAGLSWSSSVGSLASATFSHTTIFSPTAGAPLPSDVIEIVPAFTG
jgi:hypothetical protein